MFFIIILGFVSTANGGLFKMAARQGDIEDQPLWEQVKALERVNMFLEEVQEEVKESRDLLRHINFKNFFNYSFVKSVNESFMAELTVDGEKMPTVGEEDTFIPTVADEVNTTALKSTLLPEFTLPVDNSSATADSTNPATPNPVNETPESANDNGAETEQSTTLDDDKESRPTPFIRHRPAIRISIVPDVEPEYKEILPYFRGRHVPERSYNKKYPRDKLFEERMPYEYSKNSRFATYKRNTPRHLSSVSLIPPYRNIIAVKDYVLNRRETTTSKYSNLRSSQSYKATRKLKNINQDNTKIKDVNAQFSHEAFYSDKIQEPHDILYNNFKNYGQKRFYVVTPSLARNRYQTDATTTRNIQRAIQYAKLYNRPTADGKIPEARRPILVHRASNEYLRKITGASSYSDEETALKVNLLDQLYHYNKTLNEDGAKTN